MGCDSKYVRKPSGDPASFSVTLYVTLTFGSFQDTLLGAMEERRVALDEDSDEDDMEEDDDEWDDE